MYENGGIESRRFLFHIYYVIALARLGNRLFSRYGKTENAMPYSFIIALNPPLFQQSLTLRRREYLFCTMNPATCQSYGMGGIHQIAHYERAVVNISRHTLVGQNHKHYRSPIERVGLYTQYFCIQF